MTDSTIKKTLLLTIILINSIYSIVLSQNQTTKIDSNVYNTYSKLDYVDSIFYTNTLYNNKKTKEEGWTIRYFNRKNLPLPFIESRAFNAITFVRLGIWKRYYRNGKIKNIDTIPENWNNAWGSQTYYNKRGHIYKKLLIKTSTELADVGKNSGDTEIWIYYKKGREIRKKIYQIGKMPIIEKKNNH